MKALSAQNEAIDLLKDVKDQLDKRMSFCTKYLQCSSAQLKCKFFTQFMRGIF